MSLLSLILLYLPGGHRCSTQLRKDTDTATPSSDVAQKCGPKRNTSAAGKQCEADASDDSEPTPWKAEKCVGALEFHIFIESPLKTRAKQRIRTNEAGDAADVPENFWVGRGDVSLPHIPILASADTLSRIDVPSASEAQLWNVSLNGVQRRQPPPVCSAQ
jgi:hypothetical protein